MEDENVQADGTATDRPNDRIGIVGKPVPDEIRLIDAETLVHLRRKGEEIGLSGRFRSVWLSHHLDRTTSYPIHVALINSLPLDGDYRGAPIKGRCYRCLVASRIIGGRQSKFLIDLDSVDFDALPLATPGDIRELAHHWIDHSPIDGIWTDHESTRRMPDAISGAEITLRVRAPNDKVTVTITTGEHDRIDFVISKQHALRIAQTLESAGRRVEGELV